MSPHISENGDVICSALSPAPMVGNTSEQLEADFRIYRGQIEKVYTVDDKISAQIDSARYTLYDVRLLSSDGGTELAKKCRALQPLYGGGVFDYLEVAHGDLGPTASSAKTERKLRKGAYVAVAFLAGSRHSPVILGALPHDSDKSPALRPKKSDGKCLKGEFNGLQYKIANDGSLQITYNGPRNDSGAFTGKGPTDVKLMADGSVAITTSTGQTVKIDQTNKKVTILNGSTTFTMDGNTGKIQAVAPVVEVGAGTLEPILLGDQWVKIMEKLIDEIAQIIVPTGTGPSGVPTNAGKIKAIKSQLKEALSKKHKVE